MIWATSEGEAPLQLNRAVAFPSVSVVTIGGCTNPAVVERDTFLFWSGFVSASRTKMVNDDGVDEVVDSSKGNARINELSADGVVVLLARLFFPIVVFKKTSERKSAKERRKTDMSPVSFLSILYCKIYTRNVKRDRYLRGLA